MTDHGNQEHRVGATWDPGDGVDTEPFFVPGGPVGCLLVHGFTGTPHDMRYIAGGLHGAGFTVCAVRLPGHATSPEDMAQRSWRDWYAGASDGLTQLRESVSRVVVVGQSMGALLALKLAAERPDEVDSIGLLSTALTVSARWMYWVAPLLPILTSVLPDAAQFVSKGDSDIADPEARAASPTYKRVAVQSIHELLQLQSHVRPLLARIRQPALVIHSRQDHACPLDNVAILQRELGGPVRSVILSDSYHVVSVDVDKEHARREIVRFIESVG